MLRSTAWRILAEEFDAKNVEFNALCDNLRFDTTNERLACVPWALRSAMILRIALDVGDPRTLAYPHISSWNVSDPIELNTRRQELRDARVLACLMFSEEAASEEKEAVNA